jgi:hypothetical protein
VAQSPTSRAKCAREMGHPRFSLLLERLTATVADVQDVYSLVLEREQNPIHMGCVALEQVAHFKGECRALGSYWAPLWKLSKRSDSILQGQKPPDAGVSGMLR